MSLFAKIMVVLNFFLAVAFLAAAGTLLGAAEDWKKRYEEVDTNSKAQIQTLDQQVKNADQRTSAEHSKFVEEQKGHVDAEAKTKMLTDANATVEAANADLRSTLGKLTDTQKDLQSKNNEQNQTIDRLRGELSTAESTRRDVEAKYKAAQDENARLAQGLDTAEKSLASQQSANTDMTSKLDELNTTLARYRTEKGNLTGAISMKAVKGVVQAVSNKDDIFVISVGKKDGVEAGYEFTVYRDSEYVSTIVIDKVFDQYASGRTKPGTKRKDVMAGDEASTSL